MEGLTIKRSIKPLAAGGYFHCINVLAAPGKAEFHHQSLTHQGKEITAWCDYVGPQGDDWFTGFYTDQETGWFSGQHFDFKHKFNADHLFNRPQRQ